MSPNPWLVLVGLVTIWWIITAVLLVLARREAAAARLELMRVLRGYHVGDAITFDETVDGAVGGISYRVLSTMGDSGDTEDHRPLTAAERKAQEEAEKKRLQEARLAEIERQQEARLTAESEAGLGRMLRTDVE